MPIRKKLEDIKYEQLRKLYNKLQKKQDTTAISIKEIKSEFIRKI